jgi:hypothetical protein
VLYRIDEDALTRAIIELASEYGHSGLSLAEYLNSMAEKPTCSEPQLSRLFLIVGREKTTGD